MKIYESLPCLTSPTTKTCRWGTAVERIKDGAPSLVAGKEFKEAWVTRRSATSREPEAERDERWFYFLPTTVQPVAALLTALVPWVTDLTPRAATPMVVEPVPSRPTLKWHR